MATQLLKEEYSTNNVRLNIDICGQPNYAHNRGTEKFLSELDIRALNKSTQSNRFIMVLADGKESLIVDIKNDTKDNIYDAVGYQYTLIINQFF